MTAEFLNLTLKPRIDQTKNTDSANQSKQTQDKTAKENEQLKKTSVFTAEKNGLQPQNKTQQPAANESLEDSGLNAFGESGYGDTVSFSTKPTETNDTGVSKSGFTGKTSTAVNFANNDSEIKDIAEELGVEADESTVKNKLTSMNPEELVKLSDDTLEKAKDLGLISMSDIEKKIGNNSQKTENKEDKDLSKKIKFGTFTSGNEV